MKLTDEDIEAFNDVYEKEYGVRLSKEDAWEIVTRLVAFYEVVSRPLPEKPGGEELT